jgi:predicted ATPase/class 3 adenylate cyclase
MAELPSGTVTFLFTDIEGSTRLLHELGERYPEVLSEHRRVLRAAFRTHQGVEVDTQGDAFFVAFPRAADAVAAATDAQRAFAIGAVRVRMGLHTGQPVVRDGGYMGIDVHRGARICAAGHGGQVLLSVQTRRALPPDVEVRDLGEHRLKDLPAAEWLFQLLAAGLEERFPPIRSLNNTNLPTSTSSLIGRQRESAEISSLLSRDDVRLVTLTGPGGTGKTRLAVSVAASLVEQFRNGVFLVELAVVIEAAQVLPAIARTLGVKDSGSDPLETLQRAFEGKSTLLVLDNLEQIVDAAPDIARLLEAARGLKVLATSREHLRIGGEHEYAVESLPDDDAVELFEKRARANVPDFQIDGTREDVVAICRRLDGLPLAIELAAARVSLFRPVEMLDRLERRLPVLAPGRRDQHRRQHTLHATIAWSYTLLDAQEQAGLARLSTFVGGFTAEAAEEVCGANVDQLGSLFEKSLLRRHDVAARSRFSMLETIREYAMERLQESRSGQDWRDRHARHFLAFAQAAHDEMLAGGHPSADQIATAAFFGAANEISALDRLAPERDNLTAALGWFVERADALSAVAMAVNLARLWMIRGTLADGRMWTERVMALDGAEDVPDFAWLLTVASEFPHWQGDSARAQMLLERAAAQLGEQGDQPRVDAANFALANILALQKDFARSRALSEEALERARASDDATRIWQALNALGVLAFYEKDYERMATLAAAELEGARRTRSPNAIHSAAHSAAEAHRHLGDLRRAAAHYEESLSVTVALRDDAALAESFDGLGDVALALGDHAGAVPLWAVAERLLEETGFAPWDPEGQREGIAVARRMMGDAAFDEAWRVGLALTRDEAVARASAVVARA